MTSRQENADDGALSRCHLYGILDLGYVQAQDVARIADEMIKGGVDIMQLRAKGKDIAEITAIARDLRVQTSSAGVPLIINDYAQIARDVGAEGVHVGQDDLSVADVRKILGPYGLVGKSTHSFDQAREAAAEGADYIGFGPLFATPTKPDYAPTGLAEISAVHAAVSIPIFASAGSSWKISRK